VSVYSRDEIAIRNLGAEMGVMRRRVELLESFVVQVIDAIHGVRSADELDAIKRTLMATLEERGLEPRRMRR
jgi:hypothetical protein